VAQSVAINVAFLFSFGTPEISTLKVEYKASVTVLLIAFSSHSSRTNYFSWETEGGMS
jgi:hypothetical protein